MAFSSCYLHPQISLKIDCPGLAVRPSCRTHRGSVFVCKRANAELFGEQVVVMGAQNTSWSFTGGSRAIIRPTPARIVLCRKCTGVNASWFVTSQIAGSVFTLGTAAVLPFYTLMVLAPKTQLTKKWMESSIPFVVLGLLYAYLLCLSWTPDTIGLMFASKYWLPELPGIAKMFSSEMTLASAWIHLLAVDLFVARHVYHDGLENEIETRHSISFCLLFCPVGILSHIITKTLSKSARKTTHEIH